MSETLIGVVRALSLCFHLKCNTPKEIIIWPQTTQKAPKYCSQETFPVKINIDIMTWAFYIYLSNYIFEVLLWL